MSFLITSNTSDLETTPLTAGINRPFSYFNNLQDTLKIPKNSEIAVQSVKINKEGNISVNRSNNQFYLYHGTKITSTIDDTTSYPVMGWFDNLDGDTIFSPNTDEFAESVQRGFRRANLMPNNQISATNSSGARCIVKRSASGTDFEGFEISFTTSASSSNVDNKNLNWLPAYANYVGDDFSVNGTGTEITNNEAASEVLLIGTDFPLSLANGCFVSDTADFDHNLEEWSIGLTRCTRLGRVDENGSYSANPSNKLEEPSYFDGNGFFYDYVLLNEDNGNGSYFLKLQHATMNPATNELEMSEVDYRTKLGIANYIDANASNITKVEWGIKNEQVTIRVFNAGAGPGTGFITLANGLDANASRNLKPLNQCCWLSYPKVEIPAGKKLTIDTYNGIDITNYQYGSETFNSTTGRHQQINCDWWATQVNLSREQIYCLSVDSRYMNETGNILSYTQKGLNSGNAVNKDYVLVLTQSDTYSLSAGANANRLLGFDNRGLVDTPNTAGSTLVTFISDNIPKFTSTNSLFIRLKNMTFNSVNFSKSSESKILYHLPRFDNSGVETGGLFFEPTERVYLKLNNMTDLFINDIEVDIVNSNETLARNLTGKTIVCFHIRDAK